MTSQPLKAAQVDAALLRAAWDWVLRLREATVTQDDMASWLRWYDADERHKAAFEEMQSFWQQIDRVAEEPDALPAELWLGALARPPASAPVEAASSLWRSWRGAAAAISAVAVLLLAWPMLMELFVPTVDAPELPALVQESSLPDGSRVDVAPKSLLFLRYTEAERVIEMKTGEAYFRVAHNPDRPFIVRAGDAYVRAVGTAFNVRRSAGRVVVTVVEGAVDVFPSSPNNSRSREAPYTLRVAAGSAAILNEGGTPPELVPIDIAYAVSWQEGRLEYLNEPLSSAVADINRYSTQPVVIGDAAVGRIAFSGTVLAGATDDWIRALPELFPVNVQRRKDGTIVLVSHRASASTSSKQH